MLSYPVVVLAGGLATRLRPVTEHIPKVLVEINGETLLIHQLRNLRRQGCTEVILCIGYLGEMIKAVAKDGTDFGLRIHYSYDGDHLLGTAGALRRALPLIKTDACFVLYGDSYLVCDFHFVEQAFLAQRKPALMTVFRNSELWDTSNVEFLDGVIRRYSKKNKTKSMQYIDYGLGILTRSVIELIPDGEASDLGQLYERLVEQGKMGAFEVHQRFFEAGSFQGIADLAEFLKGSEERENPVATANSCGTENR